MNKTIYVLERDAQYPTNWIIRAVPQSETDRRPTIHSAIEALTMGLDDLRNRKASFVVVEEMRKRKETETV
jgi:hypothetical protein